MRLAAKESSARKGASSANVGNNLAFSVESYAAKKKLLTQMMDALKVAKKVQKEDRLSRSNQKKQKRITFKSTDEDKPVSGKNSPIMVDLRRRDAK